MIGRTISHYHITEKLGQGGMGVVYKAQDTRLDRIVALKFLPHHLSADEAANKRFIHEAKAASALNHPNICTIYDIGETEEGRLYLAMEYIEGETLKAKVARGPLEVEEALDYTLQVARGLSKAHAAGIVNRDVKPANVMVTGDGVVKIVDFGLAKVVDVSLTKTGSTLGTVAYMSPEQTRGEEVDARTDVWALGVVLYEMLTGKRPFKGDYEQAIIYSVLNVEPEPVAALRLEVPEGLAQIVHRALEKDPDRRYPNAHALKADLEALSSRASLTLPATPAVETSPAPTRLPGKWVVAAILAVMLAAGAYVIGAALNRGSTGDTSARFARGTELLSEGGEPNLREAISVFSSCVEVAPDYAPCHAGLARTYASISGDYNIISPDAEWPTARREAEKAVELGGYLAVAHLALAEVIAGQDWDWAAAERHYQHAVEIDSNDLGTLHSHAWFLYRIGRHDESSAMVARIRELDPEFSNPYREHVLTGDTNRAKKEAAELIASDPENPGGYWTSANIHAREGEYEQAAEQLLKQIPLMDGDVVDEVALLGHVYARMGRNAEARQMLERLDELSGEGRYVSPANKAWIHAGLGEVDETLDLLREGIETHANRSGLGMTEFAFVFEPISGDARFGALLEELGLTE